MKEAKGLIDVWYISVDKHGGYWETDVRQIADMIKDMDNDSEYIIKKERILKAVYDNLPEFTGF